MTGSESIMSMLRPESLDINIDDSASLKVVPISEARRAHQERSHTLSYALQSTLDLKTIIEQFVLGIKAEVPCDCVAYSHSDDRISINIGKAERHSFSYRLTIEEEYLGDIVFSRRSKFSDAEVLELEDLLCLLLFPLRNSLQYHRAVKAALHDPLTGVSNRAALTPALQRDIEMAKRYTTSFSLLALDLDFFKAINDNFGHIGGDILLKAFTDTLAECVRDTDVIFRTGGEEFVVLLARADTEGAILLADRIRKQVESLVCEHKGMKLNTTVSIGVASYVSGDSELSLLEKADEALYRAKGEGRNRVCI